MRTSVLRLGATRIGRLPSGRIAPVGTKIRENRRKAKYFLRTARRSVRRIAEDPLRPCGREVRDRNRESGRGGTATSVLPPRPAPEYRTPGRRVGRHGCRNRSPAVRSVLCRAGPAGGSQGGRYAPQPRPLAKSVLKRKAAPLFFGREERCAAIFVLSLSDGGVAPGCGAAIVPDRCPEVSVAEIAT